MVVNPLGEVLCEADENEAIVYADIGEFSALMPERKVRVWAKLLIDRS
jgi:predicted amidohydrolase